MTRTIVLVLLVLTLLGTPPAQAGFPGNHHNPGPPVMQPPGHHGHHLSPIEYANRVRWIGAIRQIEGILRYQTPTATWQARSALDNLMFDVQRYGEPSPFNRDVARQLRFAALQLQGVHAHYQVSQMLYSLDVYLWRSLGR